jgi:DNA-binding NarL/FixJ family response regulator
MTGFLLGGFSHSTWYKKFRSRHVHRRGYVIMRYVTPQKLEILQAVADGKNYRDIASSRGTTEQVVKNQMVRILRELRAENRVTAVATAIRQGLID